MNPKQSTREKRKLFFTMKPQLINIEGTLELENRQWMLKLVSDGLKKRTGNLRSITEFPHKSLINFNGKKK